MALSKVDGRMLEINALVVSARMFGSDLSGGTASRALAKRAWQYAVANDLPFLVPIFEDGEPLIVTVGTGGRDFSTRQAAHDATLNWIFPGQIPKQADTLPVPLNSQSQFALIFSCKAEEEVTSGKGLVWNHPAGNVIKLFGEDAVGLAREGTVSTSFSGGVHLIKIRFSAGPAAGVRVGGHMRVLFPTGTGADVNQIDGLWRVAAVDPVVGDAPKIDVTLAVFSHEMAAPMTITALSGGIYVYIPSGLRGINQPANGAQNGIIDVAANCVLHVDDFYVSGVDSGTNDAETNNYLLRYNAKLYCHGYGGGAEGQRTCFWGLADSFAQIDNWAFCGADNYGISGIQNRVDGQNCSASGNLIANVVPQFGSDMSLILGNWGGSGGKGFDVTGGGRAIASGVCNKCDVGVYTRADGRFDGIDMTVKDHTTAPFQRIGLGGIIQMDTLANTNGTPIPAFNLGDSRGGGISTTNKTGSTGSLKGNVAWNPASVANGAQTSTTLTITGAVLGMPVVAWTIIALSGLRLWGEVTAADTVTLYLANTTGGAVDLGLATFYAKVIPGET
jgi:hypothetical protein